MADRGTSVILNLETLKWRSGPPNIGFDFFGVVAQVGNSFITLGGNKLVSKIVRDKWMLKNMYQYTFINEIHF